MQYALHCSQLKQDSLFIKMNYFATLQSKNIYFQPSRIVGHSTNEKEEFAHENTLIMRWNCSILRNTCYFVLYLSYCQQISQKH